MIDSVVESNSTAAFVSSGVGSRISKLTALGSDFISAPGPEPAIEAAASTPEQPVRVSLKNSIVHDVTEGAEQQKDLVADSATIEADHSSFTTSFASGGGTAPSPGSGTNVAGDPGFAGPETLALAPSSALIDRGDPAIVESGETDFEGTPRSLDGNHDCIATPDIGALELERPELSSLSPASEGGDRDSDRLRIRDHEQEVRAEGRRSRRRRAG